MTLGDLLPAVDPRHGAIPVTGLTADSRCGAAGSVFFAVPGVSGDGLAYAADAAA